MKRMFVLTVVLSMVASASAEWVSVVYEKPWTSGLVNDGSGTEGGFYTSTKPLTGPWTESYDLRTQAYVGVQIWSANTLNINEWNLAAGNGGQPSEFAIKIKLSQPITSATWDATGIPWALPGMWGRFSVDGINWQNAADYGATSDPGPVTLNTGLTQTVYLDWSCPTGYWNLNSTGPITFTPVPEPATMGFLGLAALLRFRRRS